MQTVLAAAQVMRTARELAREAATLLAESILGAPTPAMAGCYLDYSRPCTLCNGPECGASLDKRQYPKYCQEFGTCGSGWQWCFKGCVCDYC